jgi:hypothetical protein
VSLLQVHWVWCGLPTAAGVDLLPADLPSAAKVDKTLLMFTMNNTILFVAAAGALGVWQQAGEQQRHVGQRQPGADARGATTRCGQGLHDRSTYMQLYSKFMGR